MAGGNKKKPPKDVPRLNTVMRLAAPLEEGFLGTQGRWRARCQDAVARYV